MVIHFSYVVCVPAVLAGRPSAERLSTGLLESAAPKRLGAALRTSETPSPTITIEITARTLDDRNGTRPERNQITPLSGLV